MVRQTVQKGSGSRMIALMKRHQAEDDAEATDEYDNLQLTARSLTTQTQLDRIWNVFNC